MTSFLFRQMLRFGLVGILAAAVHFTVVILLVQMDHWQPLLANMMGFMTAFHISYFGHRQFTFRATNIGYKTSVTKLLVVQLLNLCANESLFYIFLKTHLPYQIALLIVLTIFPLFTFASSKFWVFNESNG